jgi:hypothetical protein
MLAHANAQADIAQDDFSAAHHPDAFQFQERAVVRWHG